jgi:hypothetical protein
VVIVVLKKFIAINVILIFAQDVVVLEIFVQDVMFDK